MSLQPAGGRASVTSTMTTSSQQITFPIMYEHGKQAIPSCECHLQPRTLGKQIPVLPGSTGLDHTLLGGLPQGI